jgi:hypothetical protein
MIILELYLFNDWVLLRLKILSIKTAAAFPIFSCLKMLHFYFNKIPSSLYSYITFFNIVELFSRTACFYGQIRRLLGFSILVGEFLS